MSDTTENEVSMETTVLFKSKFAQKAVKYTVTFESVQDFLEMKIDLSRKNEDKIDLNATAKGQSARFNVLVVGWEENLKESEKIVDESKSIYKSKYPTAYFIVTKMNNINDH